MTLYTCSHFTEETQTVLAFVLNRHGAINVSYANLDAVTHLCNKKKYRTSESDYLTALASDLEVAIQERKIQIMAARLCFEFILEPSSYPRPSLIYSSTDDESLVEDLNLRPEDTVCGSIYVVNTHGHHMKNISRLCVVTLKLLLKKEILFAWQKYMVLNAKSTLVLLQLQLLTTKKILVYAFRDR